MKATVSRVGKYPVEQVNCPATGPADLTRPRAGVLHTTEGPWESALAEFKTKFAPHFLVGRDRAGKVRIAQFVSLGNYASALENASGGVETNRWAVVQIEVAGFSKETPYIFDAGTLDALAELLAYLNRACAIPLTRPFPDKMPAKPWATVNFVRRHVGNWGKTAGWYGHVEVPENSHWDPGALQWSRLLSLAKLKLTASVPPPPPPVPVPAKPSSVTLGHATVKQLVAELARRVGA